MAKSRSYSLNDEIINIYKEMYESLKEKTKKPIELILETALNNPNKLGDYLAKGLTTPPPFDVGKGFNNTEFILTIIDPAENALYYNLIIQSKNWECRISKNSFAAFCAENVLKINYNGLTKEYIKINIAGILDVDLFDTITMKSESYKYIRPNRQPPHIYLRLKMHRDCIQNEVQNNAYEEF